MSFCLAQTAALFLPNTWINYTDAAFGWNTLYAGLSVVSYGLGLSMLPRLLVGRVGEV
eukprot:COSAG01_NODE_10852_length_2068_cov_2.046724_3_plen_58_part_00